jgi:HK97 family phage major capsid protein
VPTELSTEVLRIEKEGYGVARQEMRYLPFGGSGDTRIIPKLASSVSVFWTLEGGKKGGTKAQFGVVTQILKKLTAIVPITEELIEDSQIDIVKLVAELFVEAVAVEEDLQYFDGDGTVWTGLLRTSSIPALAIAAGSTFAAMTADDLLKLQGKVKKAARTRGKYYMSSAILDLCRLMKDANDQYIFRDIVTSGSLPTLWGKPVVEVEAMPNTDLTNPQQANKHFVLFGDMKLGAIYGDKGEIKVKMLSEATITDADGSTQINLAEQDMVGVRIVKRTGYVVANEQALARLKTNAS